MEARVLLSEAATLVAKDKCVRVLCHPRLSPWSLVPGPCSLVPSSPHVVGCG